MARHWVSEVAVSRRLALAAIIIAIHSALVIVTVSIRERTLQTPRLSLTWVPLKQEAADSPIAEPQLFADPPLAALLQPSIKLPALPPLPTIDDSASNPGLAALRPYLPCAVRATQQDVRLD